MIRDAFGDVLYTAYVDNVEDGLRGADLSGLDGSEGQMQGLDFTGAHMYAAKLRSADLSFAILNRADLRGAALEGAICTGASFRDANLGRDNLGARTTLQATDLSRSDLTNANLVDAVYNDKTKFPPGFSPRAHNMIHESELPPRDAHRTDRG